VARIAERPPGLKSKWIDTSFWMPPKYPNPTI
jgi:hypothetical protein